jgi:RNA polymerase sigma factor (sigma-70 family)
METIASHHESGISSKVGGYFPIGQFFSTSNGKADVLPIIWSASQTMTLEIENKKKLVNHLNGLVAAIAKNQDRKAFKEFFEHFAPRVKAFILGQGTDPQMAEEIVQETMVKVWRKAPQFDVKKASAATWVFTIARNLRIDHLRKFHRPEPDMDDPSLVTNGDPSAYESLSLEQESQRLRNAMKSLPVEQQKVLKMAFLEEKSHPQVAEELGLPLGTVKSRIRLAMSRLRSDLGDKE